MESLLVDMGLQRLVVRALRRCMGSVREIMDGALFYGRSWTMTSGTAPMIEVLRLTQTDDITICSGTKTDDVTTSTESTT